MTRAIVLVITILALWGLAAWSESGALYSGSNLPAYLRLASAILGILVTSGLISSAILEFAIRRSFKAEPVGAQRVIVFVAVTLLVSVVTMKILGYDITTILTTSALLTAIVGFALQPTLGGLFSGIALQLDSHLKPGDGIRYQGNDVKIESMNWRSVVGRRRDDTLRE